MSYSINLIKYLILISVARKRIHDGRILFHKRFVGIRVIPILKLNYSEFSYFCFHIVQPLTTFVMHFCIQSSNFVGLFLNENSIFLDIVPTPKSNVSAKIDHLT